VDRIFGITLVDGQNGMSAASKQGSWREASWRFIAGSCVTVNDRTQRWGYVCWKVIRVARCSLHQLAPRAQPNAHSYLEVALDEIR